MGNIVDYAINELNIAFPNKEDKVQQTMNENIIEIIKLLESQGHTGTTIKYLFNKVERLINFKPLTSIDDNPEEWRECFGRTTSFQHKRCPSVFKDENGYVKDINGRVFSDDGGFSWFGSRDSSVPVTFPYLPPTKPKKVYIQGDIFNGAVDISDDKELIDRLYEEAQEKYEQSIVRNSNDG